METNDKKLKLFILYKILCEKLDNAVDFGILKKETRDRFLKIGINNVLKVDSDDLAVDKARVDLMALLDLKEINDFINKNFDRIKEKYLPEYETLYNFINCSNN